VWLKKRIKKNKNKNRNRFPFISVIDEASDFKFGMQLGFAKGHHQNPLEEKVGVVLG